MKRDMKDVAVRAAKTFAEAAAAFVLAEIAGAELFAMEGKVWLAIGISAAAAGLSAVWNGVIEPMVAPAIYGAKNQEYI